MDSFIFICNVDGFCFLTMFNQCIRREFYTITVLLQRKYELPQCALCKLIVKLVDGSSDRKLHCQMRQSFKFNEHSLEMEEMLNIVHLGLRDDELPGTNNPADGVISANSR